MRKIVTGLVALSLATAAFAQGSPQVIGVTSAVVREAKLSNARIATPRAITLRERIALADLIQTGKQSQVQLMLLDRSVFSIGANARLRIDRFVYDPAAGRSMGASVAKGAFRFMSGRPARQNASSVSTPVATIGIRGTVFDGAVGKTAIDVAKGEVVRAMVRDADPETATLVVLRGPGAGAQGLATPGAISVTAGGATVDLNTPMLAALRAARGRAAHRPLRAVCARSAPVAGCDLPGPGPQGIGQGAWNSGRHRRGGGRGGNSRWRQWHGQRRHPASGQPDRSVTGGRYFSCA